MCDLLRTSGGVYERRRTGPHSIRREVCLRFYLGTHCVNWLWRSEFQDVPLFLSRTTIGKRKGLKPVVTNWGLDSGAFTELLLNGRWSISPRDYADLCLRLRDGCGRMDFCSIQDWMCEREIIEGGTISGRRAPGTGKTLLDHQKLTVESYFTLSAMEPTLPFLPALQGFTVDEYLRCIEMYAEGGLDLRGKWVGLGSVCRRQGTTVICSLIEQLAKTGLLLHGYGVKVQGLERIARYLHSADSMAWSYGARVTKTKMPECVAAGRNHKNCANCPVYALHWLHNTIEPAIKKGTCE